MAGAVLVADQLSKAWAASALADGTTVEIVGDTVRFRLLRNSGSAFSLFTGYAPVLAVVAAVLVVVIFRMGRRETDPLASTALALVLGGALGNLGDRIFRAPGFLEGAVVDFVDVGRWPTFNVADSAITIGAAILVLTGWRLGRPAARGQDTTEPDDGTSQGGTDGTSQGGTDGTSQAGTDGTADGGTAEGGTAPGGTERGDAEGGGPGGRS